MLPELQAATEMTSKKLQMLASKMKKPLPENYSVINTFPSDGDRYFHYPGERKWRQKLMRLQPEEGKVTVIDLPDSFDMYCSQIF